MIAPRRAEAPPGPRHGRRIVVDDRWPPKSPSRGSDGIDLRLAPHAVGDVLPFAAVAGVLITAGGLVAAVNSAAPFAHGSWLSAYLVLVGGIAQLALAAGRLGLPAANRSARLRRAQLCLWNAGGAAVAAGVLADSGAVLLAGSALVLAALACFGVGAGPGGRDLRGRVVLYRVLIGGLAVSVVIGIILAGTSPGR